MKDYENLNDLGIILLTIYIENGIIFGSKPLRFFYYKLENGYFWIWRDEIESNLFYWFIEKSNYFKFVKW